MNQGEAIAIDGRTHTWTPLRVVLVLLGAVLGGLLLTLLTGGHAAHADTPDAPPSLLGSVTSTVADDVVAPVAQHVLPVAAPVTNPVGTALREPAADAAALVSPVPGTSAVTTIDGLLDAAPIASTPAWKAIIGPHPLSTVLSPVGTVLGSAVPGLAPVADTILAPMGASPAARIAGAPVVVSAAVAAASSALSGAVGTLLDAGRNGLPPAPPAVVSNGAFSPLVPASVLSAFALLFLALLTARRDDGSVPSSPVYETDSSPD